MIDELRRLVRPAPPEFGEYLEKVRLHAHKVTDADVEALKAAGFSEDEIFEHTVSAALAAVAQPVPVLIVRLADSLGWDVPSFDEFYGRADRMLATGYKLE